MIRAGYFPPVRPFAFFGFLVSQCRTYEYSRGRVPLSSFFLFLMLTFFYLVQPLHKGGLAIGNNAS